MNPEKYRAMRLNVSKLQAENEELKEDLKDATDAVTELNEHSKGLMVGYKKLVKKAETQKKEETNE